MKDEFMIKEIHKCLTHVASLYTLRNESSDDFKQDFLLHEIYRLLEGLFGPDVFSFKIIFDDLLNAIEIKANFESLELYDPEKAEFFSNLRSYVIRQALRCYEHHLSYKLYSN